ncbi:helix-turn-helix transcriptional regulator [Noviherbaspirillum denitrificans]|uniref:HTH luxR-type domain-containing protein n=1 Tax=Noviherbaspirillum denitrificans TaxID=1968433 RepID=A0A254TD49_9BURK|nr:LuxR C-terminal-related transcriptional regulator [Noviherbaspirillum denitrificans]OWW20570.1 hypothetical protein AYR66_14800 [Noviherbaspirillum denitrificans]
MLEKFSKAVANMYWAAQQSEPALFRQELLDLACGLVDCDGGALSIWQLATTSRGDGRPERARARIVTLIQQAQVQPAPAFCSSMPSPHALNGKSEFRLHPVPWIKELHDDESIEKLILLGDVNSTDAGARWLILFRCSDRDFTARDAALLDAFWHLAKQSIDINLQYALSRVVPQGAGRSVALVNSQGIIEIADDRVKDLLLQEWPLLRGVALPKTALASLLATSSYRGKSIEIQASRKAGYLACTMQKIHAATLLTPSEISAVQCFARGMTHSAIAFQFGVSPHTVRNQLANAYRKLGVHSKAELIRVISDF